MRSILYLNTSLYNYATCSKYCVMSRSFTLFVIKLPSRLRLYACSTAVSAHSTKSKLDNIILHCLQLFFFQVKSRLAGLISTTRHESFRKLKVCLLWTNVFLQIVRYAGRGGRGGGCDSRRGMIVGNVKLTQGTNLRVAQVLLWPLQ